MSASISKLVFDEIERVYVETGVYPLRAYVSIDTFCDLKLITARQSFDFYSSGFQGMHQLAFHGAWGRVYVEPSSDVPDGVCWAGPGRYSDYWARRILLGDDDVDLSDR
jgi:hypothetical protein